MTVQTCGGNRPKRGLSVSFDDTQLNVHIFKRGRVSANSSTENELEILQKIAVDNVGRAGKKQCRKNIEKEFEVINQLEERMNREEVLHFIKIVEEKRFQGDSRVCEDYAKIPMEKLAKKLEKNLSYKSVPVQVVATKTEEKEEYKVAYQRIPKNEMKKLLALRLLTENAYKGTEGDLLQHMNSVEEGTFAVYKDQEDFYLYYKLDHAVEKSLLTVLEDGWIEFKGERYEKMESICKGLGVKQNLIVKQFEGPRR